MNEGAATTAATIWFAAHLRVVCFVDGREEQEDLLRDEVVHLFRAPDRDAAFERVVKAPGFPAESLDGAEVSSNLSRTDFLPFDTRFEPRAHLPGDDPI